MTAFFTMLIFSLYGILLYARSASSYNRQTQSIEKIQAMYAQDVPNAARIAEQLKASSSPNYQGEAMMIARNVNKGFWQADYKDKITSIEFKHGDTTLPEGATDLGNLATNTSDAEIRAYLQDDGTGNGTYKCTVISPAKIFANVNAIRYFFEFEKLEMIDFLNFNTSKVTSMESMFLGCIHLRYADVSSFDTSNVRTFHAMFYNCAQLVQLDTSSWNTNQVKTMFAMFYNCAQLTELDVSRFSTSDVTTMQSMFASCKKLKAIDLSSFSFNSNVNCKNMLDNMTATVYVKDLNDAKRIYDLNQSLTIYYGKGLNWTRYSE